ILRVLRDSSLIDNEIAEMHCSARTIDREPRHIHICLIRDCAGREKRASQELSARICKNLLIRRLTAKRETVLLEARDWPGEDRELTTDLKIRCGDRAEKSEDAVMNDSVPASSAGKK
ncbi:hypothetical protein BDFG_09390, partial [Blastomyces dermatitidis ATCC 26199]